MGYSDSDFAGCRRTSRSTSGGVVMRGSHHLKSWSSTQSVISLSSGEAEYYALVEGASADMGIAEMFRELNCDAKVEIKSDASAAIGISMIKGLGRVRHIEVSQLWVQEKISTGKIRVVKVKTNEHLSDALTKGIGFDEMQWHMSELNQKRMSKEE